MANTSSLLSRIVHKFNSSGRVLVCIVVDDSLDEVGFISELDDLLRKYGKDVVLRGDVE